MKRFFVLAVVCWLGGSLAPPLRAQVNTDWVLPIGIPLPPLGVTNTHWQYTNSAVFTWEYTTGVPEPYRTNEFGPYTHYIDNTHPSAADGTNTWGTPEKPRLTWVYPLPAGSVVQVKGGGSYSFSNGSSGTMRSGGPGTSATNMLFFVGTHATTNLVDWPLITRSEFYVPGDWVGIEGFNFTNNGSLMIRGNLMAKPCTNIMVRSNYFWGTGVAGNPTAITTHTGNATNWCENLVALGNVARAYGNWTHTAENDACMFILGEWTTNIWVLDNEGYNLGGDGIRVGVNTEAETETPNLFGHYIGRNHFHDNGENSLDIKRANGVIYSENWGTSYGNLDAESTGGTTLAIHYYPRNIWILYNKHWGDGDGVGENRAIAGTSQSAGTHIYIVGNRFWGYAEEAIYPDRVNGNWHIYNNVIADSHIGIYTGGTIESIDVQNNILYNITNTTLHVTAAGVRSSAIVSNELHFPLSINWGGTTYTDWATFEAAQSKGQNGLEADPLFTDAGNNDYSLTESSPAKDSGVDMAALEAALEAAFGFDADDQISLNLDPERTVRPYGAAWDRGVFEFTDGEEPPPEEDPATGTVQIGGTAVFGGHGNVK